MRRTTLKKLVVAAWIVLGTAQVVTALLDGDWFFLALGVAYTLLGVGYFWYEVYTFDQ